MPFRALLITSLALGLAASPAPQEDPVMRARAQRAAAQGISEGDLPPVPRGIVEPPPLPPPEAHVKDSRKGRQARAAKRRVKRGKARVKQGSAAARPRAAKGKRK